MVDTGVMQMTPKQVALLDACHPVLRERMTSILEKMGGRMIPFSAFRSPAEQAAIYEKGREVKWTKDWKIVSERIVNKREIKTRARPMSSAHNFNPARAIDCILNTKVVPVRKREGILDAWDDTTPEAVKAWGEYGLLVVSHGLIWGGSWESRDMPHAELLNFNSSEWG